MPPRSTIILLLFFLFILPHPVLGILPSYSSFYHDASKSNRSGELLMPGFGTHIIKSALYTEASWIAVKKST